MINEAVCSSGNRVHCLAAADGVVNFRHKKAPNEVGADGDRMPESKKAPRFAEPYVGP
ncbi:hypothetical protein EJP617_00880 [Erwinia sp. Ejp617]|nr:hypothetical protein EJP617_00880 [Erwinia sp. Ejp617]